MANKLFLNGIRSSRFRNLLTFENHDISALPGVYIFEASDGTQFIYPRGKSSIFYIGQSNSLLKRLQSHRRYMEQARTDRQYPLYEPRYEYAAAFGTNYCIIRTWQGVTPKSLEETVLTRFAKKYGAVPVANGAGTWNKVHIEIGI